MTLVQLIKSVIVVNLFSFVLLGAVALADPIPYYGEEFYQSLLQGDSDLKLKMDLKQVFDGFHMSRSGQMDVIGDSCDTSIGSCYRQNVIGYKAARAFITRDFYVHTLASGARVIEDVYCDGTKPVAKSGDSKVNVEHTWPQSHFTEAYPKEMQKSDLHHLFPTDIHVNMIRGNHQFGEVDSEIESLGCSGPRFGIGSAGSEEVFEPPQNHKGNVARALFYFAVRYEMTIGKDEEQILRQWHQEDPVDDQELERNNKIYELQNNRNPFVDFPELVDRISDF